MSAPREPTLLPRCMTRGHGDARFHAVFLQPANDPSGPCCVVAIELPKATDVLPAALAKARAASARVQILCDSAAQADAAAALAAQALPGHRRVSIRRAASGGWRLQ